jgi:hypothetical protein
MLKIQAGSACTRSQQGLLRRLVGRRIFRQTHGTRRWTASLAPSCPSSPNPSLEWNAMKHLIPLVVLAFAGSALAQGASCNTEASARKLTGTAKAEFLKKCETDTKAKLVQASKERNYSMAPKSGGDCGGSATDL